MITNSKPSLRKRDADSAVSAAVEDGTSASSPWSLAIPSQQPEGTTEKRRAASPSGMKDGPTQPLKASHCNQPVEGTRKDKMEAEKAPSGIHPTAALLSRALESHRPAGS